MSKELHSFYVDGNEKHHLGTGFLTYKRKVKEDTLDQPLWSPHLGRGYGSVLDYVMIKEIPSVVTEVSLLVPG